VADANSATRAAGRARVKSSTPVFLVGDIQATISWYQRIGFEAEYFPPGFGILSRDDVRIFVQGHPGYKRPHDPGRYERDAWDLYIETDNVAALFAEFSDQPEVEITGALSERDYGQIEFEVTDPNGYVLVFAQPSDS